MKIDLSSNESRGISATIFILGLLMKAFRLTIDRILRIPIARILNSLFLVKPKSKVDWTNELVDDHGKKLKVKNLRDRLIEAVYCRRSNLGTKVVELNHFL